MVWDITNGLRKENNLTVFLTTHYMEETKDADYVVILDHGHIVAEGSPNKLKNQYTGNKLIWHTGDNTLNQELLNKHKLDYTYNLDSYRFNYKNNESIIDFLSMEREFLKVYELIKGNMDDVFLNVTGRSID
jgi:multidrug/hemolysin transport system ATP-binding protein